MRFCDIVSFFLDSQAHKPLLSPDDPEIYISEGEALELTCTSPNDIQFYYPTDVGITVN